MNTYVVASLVDGPNIIEISAAVQWGGLIINENS